MPVHHTDLHLGASVLSSDNAVVGTLENVLVDAEGMDLRQIVVKESAKASGHHWYEGATMLIPDVVVPADAIESATHERVTLSLSLSQFRHLQPYLTHEFVGVSLKDQLAASIGMVATASPIRETVHKPAGELEVSEGEPVMFKHTGELLGHVRDLVYDDELAGVVVRPHEWLAHDVLIQVRYLDRSDDAALFAHITKDDLGRLARFDAATE